ncbi:T6SS phospholipase effector Tle1-like catalytic domain-containing protein, partial [Pseudomonas agarici]|uniref:T6SS phospholipase effector Tle1-like catalytic domain-containing protein n=1 Tax=Pseudomonas agarici TaxID=46677 RepID=UPI00210EB83D
ATAKPGMPIREPILEEEEEEEELEQSGIVLHLGLFFDGTGNNQGNSAIGEGCRASDLGMDRETAVMIRQLCTTYGFDASGVPPDNSYGNATSNVALLHDLYPDQADVQLPNRVEQAHIKVYVEGIGTSSGQSDSLYTQGSGQGDTGVVARVEQSPALVLQQLRRFRENNPSLKIRRLEVDLFGFSRGAAAARHCANDLLKGADSLLARALPVGSPLLGADFAWRAGSDVILNFIGLFDTVAGIVAPLSNDFSPHNALNPGVNLRLAPGSARQVVQLVANDEHRHNFSLTRTDTDLFVPGCHSDVGGGYLPLATENLLLSKPDSSFSPPQEPNEHSEAYRRTQQRLERSQDHWQHYIPHEGLSIVTWDTGTEHQRRDTPAQKRVYAAIAGERQVRGELSLVYLRIMRALGVRAGVAFDPVPDTPALALPTELQPIAAKLQAYALHEPFTLLNAEDLALLRRHYIHLSAHWNAAKGWNNSDLEGVFINRPAEGYQRAKYHP